MKNTNFLLLMMLLAASCFVSCEKDELTTLEDQQNALEEAKIPSETLNDGIVLEGAKAVKGTPPAPNADFGFEINSDLTSGFQSTGFRVEFNSDDNFNGAYILLKDVDGNPSDGYYDLTEFTAQSNNRKKVVKTKSTEVPSNARVSETTYDYSFEVGFNETIPPGQFCYDICLYDTANNVSQIQSVCVTVEAWGGNEAIAGEWLFDKSFDPNETDEEFYYAIYYCGDNDTLSVDYDTYRKPIKREWTLALNSDGSYFEFYDDEYQTLNDSLTSSQCALVYDTEVIKTQRKYLGNWAYNEEAEALTVVDFEYQDLLDESKNEKDEKGAVYLDGVTAEVVSEQLVLTYEDGYKLYFNKK